MESQVEGIKLQLKKLIQKPLMEIHYLQFDFKDMFFITLI